MSKSNYIFIDADATEIEKRLCEKYEELTGYEVLPASPDKLFIEWAASIILQERINLNYVGNQNIPCTAEGENLDMLGEWIFNVKRRESQAAKCAFVFEISEAQETALTIPKGTRVTDKDETLYWETTEDAIIPIGKTQVETMIQCQSTGESGNGFAEKSICVLVDVDNLLYFSACYNSQESDGGCERQTDEEYYDTLRASLAQYSTAGSRESYIYWAKTVSDDIGDVKVITPRHSVREVKPVLMERPHSDISQYCVVFGSYNFMVPKTESPSYNSVKNIKLYRLKYNEVGEIEYDEKGDAIFESEVELGISDYTYKNGLLTLYLNDPNFELSEEHDIGATIDEIKTGTVNIYAINTSGECVSETIMKAISEVCSADSVRPLTDYVEVCRPDVVDYTIDFTYYCASNSTKTATEIETGVKEAVEEYKRWQCAKMGRDINPDKLRLLLLNAGVKRVDITSPVFRKLSNGDDHFTPELARFVEDGFQIVNGGLEDE